MQKTDADDDDDDDDGWATGAPEAAGCHQSFPVAVLNVALLFYFAAHRVCVELEPSQSSSCSSAGRSSYTPPLFVT